MTLEDIKASKPLAGMTLVKKGSRLSIQPVTARAVASHLGHGGPHVSFNAVIFDIDGTLVDSVDLHARAWQEAFDHFGKQIAFDAIRAQIGKGGDHLIPHFLAPRELAAIGEKLDKFRGDIFKRQYLRDVRPFPRVRELFERLKGDGVKIVLASSAKDHELNHYVEVAKIGDLIEAKTSAGDVTNTKPDPEVVRVALGRLGKPELSKVRMVGDSPWDIEAAHGAGIACVGVLCGGFPEADLKRAGADGIFDGAAGLLDDYQRFPRDGAAHLAAAPIRQGGLRVP